MLLWFVTLGVLGAWRIILEPSVLQALNPKWAWDFIADAPWETFLLLGAIVLALTGDEILYADMGHFGRKANLRAWYGPVLPRSDDSTVGNKEMRTGRTGCAPVSKKKKK